MKSFNTMYCNFEETKGYVEANKIGEYKDVLVQLFTGISEEEVVREVIEQIRNLLPQAHIIGTTTAGEILNCQIISQSIILSFSVFEHTTIKSAIVAEAEDDFQLGQSLAKELLTENTKVMIIFGNALTLNGSDLLQGVGSIGNQFIVAGGYAGNDGYFTNTSVLCNDKITKTGAVGISLNSDVLQVFNEYSLGWRGIGKVMTVTRSEKNRVYMLDGVKTKDVYKKYLGSEVSDYLPTSAKEFPLLITGQEIPIARCPVASHDDGSVDFLGNIEQGSKVLFSYGNVKMITQRSKKIFESWESKQLEAIFVYSCSARHAFMQAEIEGELIPLRKSSVAGFFTYGEFYQSKQQQNIVLNTATTLLGLSESGKIQEEPLESYTLKEINVSSDDNFPDEKKTTVINILNNLINAVVEDLEQTNSNLAAKNSKLELYAQAIKDNQEVMIEREKAVSLGHLMAGIAHNLKTPLMTISGGVFLIRKFINQLEEKSLTANEFVIKKIKNWVDEIDESLKYIGEIISTVNGYIASPEVDNAEFAIDDLVRKINILMLHELKVSKCKLKMDITIKNKKNVIIKGNINDLVQVLNVLISNSIDSYKGSGGIIEIKIDQKDDLLEIAVTDYGNGIRQETANKLFKEMVTTKGKNGTGLGLYTSYAIVRGRLCGDITFQTLEGDGTTFQIVLPVKK
jgi:nitrogen-specific signal transduction histidine kinase